MNTGAAHGAALGQEEVDAIKNALGFDPNVRFHIDDEVLEHTRRLSARSQDARRKWQEKFDAWAKKNPEKNEFLERFRAHELPADYDAELPSWDPDEKGIATRKASGKTIQALAKSIPELWGGSADLAGSNNTAIEGADSFGPETISTDKWTAQPFGRNLHFGIREHAMSSIMNGIALHGNTRVYGGTFLIFSEYMFPAVRLGALMQNDTYYVWTHDSIGLGEDGPTHQPVETLAALRTIPHLSVIRPADANETAQAWAAALEFEPSPKGLCLTRQNVPVLEGTKEKAHDGVRRGAYTLVDAAGEAGTPDVILIGTGSEVQLAVEAARRLGEEGIAARVVSAPCLEWFDAQDAEYRESVLPSAVRARVSVEAGIAMPWHKYTGDMGENISLEHFGASAPYTELYENFGITADAVYTAAKKSLAAARGANA